MAIAIVIPAQATNRYHIDGDFAPFGDTTLLEWKLAQCIECFDTSDIYVTSDSQKSKYIAQDNNVNLLFRKENINYADVILNSIKEIDAEYIMWINPTSPFLGSLEYKKMVNEFIENIDNYDCLVTTNQRQDFIYYKNKKLNFDKHTDGRKNISPIDIATNGVYINSKNNIINNKELIGENPLLYNLDFLESLEIKDMQSYSILSELISLYFKKELNV